MTETPDAGDRQTIPRCWTGSPTQFPDHDALVTAGPTLTFAAAARRGPRRPPRR